MNKNSLTQKILGPELLSTGKAKVYAQDMTRLVDINDAGGSFTALADEVLAGQEVVFSQDGKPVLKLVPIDYSESLSDPNQKMNRPLGAWAHFDPDFDFDAWDALDEDVRKLFKHLK
jgi:antitoxin (DNA-binding transcriptional repressor) of toxin-antitoxin stability system